MIKLPHFATEREEADWWYDNRDLLEKEFLAAFKDGVKPGPSRAVSFMAEARGISVEEMQAQLRAHSTSPEEPVKLPRSA